MYISENINEFDKIQNIYRNFPTSRLIDISNYITKKYFQSKIYIRGLIEFSNICFNDCKYCGIRLSNRSVNRYELSNEKILSIIEDGYRNGIRTFVLQSGERSYLNSDYNIKKKSSNTPANLKTISLKFIEKVDKLLIEIRRRYSDEVAITLSCGVYERKTYQDWFNLGANRYLLRFETSSGDLYEDLCPGKSFSRRIQALQDLSDIGYEVGSGFLIGLPGETEEITINNLLLCKMLRLDMVGIGPFLAHPETPLAKFPSVDIEQVLKITSLLRILLPESNIPATTATGTLDKLGWEKALSSGANVLMINISPAEMKKEYLLYPGKICIYEDGFKYLSDLKVKLEKIGKQLCFERGDSLTSKRKIGINR